MIKYESDCVGCGLPCRGSSCPYYNVKHLYCDNCDEDCEELYELDGSHYCEDCLLTEITHKLTIYDDDD